MNKILSLCAIATVCFTGVSAYAADSGIASNEPILVDDLLVSPAVGEDVVLQPVAGELLLVGKPNPRGGSKPPAPAPSPSPVTLTKCDQYKCYKDSDTCKKGSSESVAYEKCLKTNGCQESSTPATKTCKEKCAKESKFVTKCNGQDLLCIVRLPAAPNKIISVEDFLQSAEKECEKPIASPTPPQPPATLPPRSNPTEVTTCGKKGGTCDAGDKNYPMLVLTLAPTFNTIDYSCNFKYTVLHCIDGKLYEQQAEQVFIPRINVVSTPENVRNDCMKALKAKGGALNGYGNTYCFVPATSYTTGKMSYPTELRGGDTLLDDLSVLQ